MTESVACWGMGASNLLGNRVPTGGDWRVAKGVMEAWRSESNRLERYRRNGRCQQYGSALTPDVTPGFVCYPFWPVQRAPSDGFGLGFPNGCPRLPLMSALRSRRADRRDDCRRTAGLCNRLKESGTT